MLKSLHIRKAFANTFFKLLKTKEKQIERDTREHQRTPRNTSANHSQPRVAPNHTKASHGIIAYFAIIDRARSLVARA